MILDARGLDTGACIEADICIIGGGAAGITLARELSGSSLEACPYVSSPFHHLTG